MGGTGYIKLLDGFIAQDGTELLAALNPCWSEDLNFVEDSPQKKIIAVRNDDKHAVSSRSHSN